MKSTSGKKPRGANVAAAAHAPRLRAKAWVEIGSAAALTDAGADLLEQIAACGSLSEAARRLHFSYRRAWMLVDAMNKRWPRRLVATAVGGERGGGARLTETGYVVLRSYRDVQLQLQFLLDGATGPFIKSVEPARVTGSGAKTVRVVRKKRAVR